MRLTVRRMVTSDKLELQGLLFEPDNWAAASRAILFVHGAGSSFCGDPFIEKTAEAVTRENVSFFAVNTRGHDVVSDFRTHEPNGEYESKRVGHAREIFEECVLDIVAAIDRLIGLGYEEVILFGHSLGALKALHYLSETHDLRVGGLILGSPPDIPGIFKRALEIARADPKTKKRLSKEKNIFIDKYSENFPSAPEMRESFLGAGAKTNLFPFSDPQGSFEALAKVTVPLLVFYGTKEEPVVIPTGTCLERIQKEAEEAPSVSTHVIRGAPHNYLGFEGEIAKTVSEWIRDAYNKKS